MQKRKLFADTIIILTAIFAMTSCIGINADIVLNSNNSGTITLEYRVSRFFDSLGRLDGNESRPPLPAGRLDFERTIQRIPGMKLLSYASRETGSDRIISVRLEFSAIEDLVKFMDAHGEKALYTNGSSHMVFVLNNGTGQGYSREMNSLISQITNGYDINISMSFPSDAAVRLLDTRGNPSSVNAAITSPGRKVSGSLPLETALTAPNGLMLEFIW